MKQGSPGTGLALTHAQGMAGRELSVDQCCWCDCQYEDRGGSDEGTGSR